MTVMTAPTLTPTRRYQAAQACAVVLRVAATWRALGAELDRMDRPVWAELHRAGCAPAPAGKETLAQACRKRAARIEMDAAGALAPADLSLWPADTLALLALACLRRARTRQGKRRSLEGLTPDQQDFMRRNERISMLLPALGQCASAAAAVFSQQQNEQRQSGGLADLRKRKGM